MTQMHHGFDLWGWYAGPVPAGAPRSTPAAPPSLSISEQEGAQRANFTGHEWLLLPYAPPPDSGEREALRAQRLEAIKAERDRRTQTGGYKVGAHWFHSDTFSRTQQIGLVMLGANIPPGLQWRTMGGAFVTMTQALAGQVFAAAAASDAALFAHGEALRAQVQAAEDPASVDILAGWPPAFGE